jgi:hypothetical protein
MPVYTGAPWITGYPSPARFWAFPDPPVGAGLGWERMGTHTTGMLRCELEAILPTAEGTMEIRELIEKYAQSIQGDKVGVVLL